MLIILEMHLTLRVSLAVALTNCDLLFLISNLEVGVGLAAQGSHQRFRLLVPFEFTILNILVLCLHRWHCIVAKWLFCFTQEGVGKGGVRSFTQENRTFLEALSCILLLPHCPELSIGYFLLQRRLGKKPFQPLHQMPMRRQRLDSGCQVRQWPMSAILLENHPVILYFLCS